MSSAAYLLDRVQTLATLDTFDPASYAAQLATEIPPASSIAELEARDAMLARSLAAIEDLITRVMRIRLEHVADAMPAVTRRVFASTVASYAGNLSMLEDRVRSTRVPEPIVQVTVGAAQATLELRDAVRAGVLALIRDVSTASIPDADRRARDRDLDDAQRKRWSAVRRDLEVLADDPERIRSAPMATRVAAWDEQLDEPAAKPEPTLAELIELD